MTKEDIRRIPKLSRLIERDELQLKTLLDKAQSVPSLNADEKVQTSKIKDRMKYVDAAVDLETELKEKREELELLQVEASEWIDTLDTSLEKRIFKMLLIKCYTWDEITELIGYSRRRLFQIRDIVIATKTE